ncbi:MAG TPA: hypothetical protein VI168_12875 [Croceibacterium sp.]
MLRSEKHRSRRHRAFAIPAKGFDGESAASKEDRESGPNDDVIKKIMREYRLPK